MKMENQPKNLVNATQLSKHFAGGTEALKAIDLRVNYGEFISIVGPSGCGKSTLLRLLAGLLPPSSGTLTVDGLPPADARRSRLDLAYVFQDATLLSWRTVEKNVALPLELRRHLRTQIAPLVAEILELVGLQDFACFYPWQLSGGMRMRVSLARALVTRRNFCYPQCLRSRIFEPARPGHEPPSRAATGRYCRTFWPSARRRIAPEGRIRTSRR